MSAQDALELRRLIPPFSLESIEGRTISPWDYKGKRSLVIVFFDPHNAEHLEIVSVVRRRHGELADANAEVLAIAPRSIDELRVCAGGLHLPFPVLSDETREVHTAYGTAGATLYAADRFGELRMISSLVGDIDGIIDNTIAVLELSELECPECGAPTWDES